MNHVETLAARVLRKAGLDHERLAVIQLNRSGPAGAFVVLLVFVDGRRQPSVLVKATQDPAKAASLAREFETLSFLRDHGSPALRRSVPEPLHLGRLEDLVVFAETALRGTRMKNFPPGPYFSSPSFRGRLTQTVEFLYEFHRCGCSDAPAEPEGIGQAVERYRRDFRVSAALERLLDETAEHLSAGTPPPSPWHGDFCTANILDDGERPIGVIDWEFPPAVNWPLADLLHFISSIWCVRYRKGQDALAENFRRIFFERHGLRDAVRRSASWYAEKLGLPTADLLPLSVASWLSYANRKRESLQKDPAASGPEPWPLTMIRDRRCLNLELLAENRERYLLDDGG